MNEKLRNFFQCWYTILFTKKSSKFIQNTKVLIFLNSTLLNKASPYNVIVAKQSKADDPGFKKKNDVMLYR